MSELSKSFIYSQLYRINNEKQINIDEYVSQMVGSDSIPYTVIVFVNKYYPIANLAMYNEIYNKRHRKSPIFKNLMKKNLPTAEKAIVLSSLLTQCLISIKHNNIGSNMEAIDSINVDLIIDTLYNYMTNGDNSRVDEIFEMYQIMFKTLFPKE